MKTEDGYVYMGRSGKINGMRCSKWVALTKFTGWMYNNKQKTKQYYKDGLLHKEDGPSVLSKDFKAWQKNGELHRIDGPAVEWADGKKFWCLDGEHYEEINIKKECVVSEYDGDYGLRWYQILVEDEVIDYPNIPGLINFS